ncbi:hypothetical protein [Pseudomonas sp. NUPR-001]|uniref:hypothetical protein n=1 Tax=Pseudomonas sp. NUPR-001 TaxID=3416058 RepID=UPI003F965FD3
MNTILKRIGALSLGLFIMYIIIWMIVEDENLLRVWANFSHPWGIFHDSAFILLGWGAMSALMALGVIDKLGRWVRYGSGGKT